MTTESSYYLAAKHFQKVDISLDEYGGYYRKGGFWGRKVEAIPSIFIALVVKTTYHVAMAVIIGIPQYMTNDDRKRLDAEGDNIRQDLNEAYAWCVILFSYNDNGDKEGCYLRDRSYFLKEQNTLWAEGKIPDRQTPPSLKDPTPPVTPQRTPPTSPKPSARKVREFFTPDRIKLLEQVTELGSHRNMPPALRKKYGAFLKAEHQLLYGVPLQAPLQSPLLKHQQTMGVPAFAGNRAPPKAPPPPPPLPKVPEEEGKENPKGKPKLPQRALSFSLGQQLKGFQKSQLQNAKKRTLKEKAPGIDDTARLAILGRRGAIQGSPKDLLSAVAATMALNPALRQQLASSDTDDSDNSDWEDSPVKRKSDPSPLKSPLPLPRRLSFSEAESTESEKEGGQVESPGHSLLKVKEGKKRLGSMEGAEKEGEPLVSAGPFHPKVEEGKKRVPLQERVSYASYKPAGVPRKPLPFLLDIGKEKHGKAPEKPPLKDVGVSKGETHIKDAPKAKDFTGRPPLPFLQSLRTAQPPEKDVTKDPASTHKIVAGHEKPKRIEGAPPPAAPPLAPPLDLDSFANKNTAAASSPPPSQTSRPMHEVIASAAKKRNSRSSTFSSFPLAKQGVPKQPSHLELIQQQALKRQERQRRRSLDLGSPSSSFSAVKQGVPKQLSHLELIQQQALERQERQRTGSLDLGSSESSTSGKNQASTAPLTQMEELQKRMAESQRRRSQIASDGKKALRSTSPSSSDKEKLSSVGSAEEVAPAKRKKRKKNRKKKNVLASEHASSSRMGEPSAKPSVVKSSRDGEGSQTKMSDFDRLMAERRRRSQVTVGSPEQRPPEQKGRASTRSKEVQETPRRKSFKELMAQFQNK